VNLPSKPRELSFDPDERGPHIQVISIKQCVKMAWNLFLYFSHRASHPLASTREHPVVGVEGKPPSHPPRDCDELVDDIDDFLDRPSVFPAERPKVAIVGVGVNKGTPPDTPSLPAAIEGEKLVVSMNALGVLEGRAVTSLGDGAREGGKMKMVWCGLAVVGTPGLAVRFGDGLLPDTRERILLRRDPVEEDVDEREELDVAEEIDSLLARCPPGLEEART